MHAIEVKTTEATKGTIEEVAQGGSSSIKSEEVVVNRSGYDLELSTSKVTQVQLDAFRTCFSVPLTITKRGPTRGKLPSNAKGDRNKIPFSTVRVWS